MKSMKSKQVRQNSPTKQKPQTRQTKQLQRTPFESNLIELITGKKAVNPENVPHGRALSSQKGIGFVSDPMSQRFYSEMVEVRHQLKEKKMAHQVEHESGNHTKASCDEHYLSANLLLSQGNAIKFLFWESVSERFPTLELNSASLLGNWKLFHNSTDIIVPTKDYLSMSAKMNVFGSIAGLIVAPKIKKAFLPQEKMADGFTSIGVLKGEAAKALYTFRRYYEEKFVSNDPITPFPTNNMELQMYAKLVSQGQVSESEQDNVQKNFRLYNVRSGISVVLDALVRSELPSAPGDELAIFEGWEIGKRENTQVDDILSQIFAGMDAQISRILSK